MFDDLGIIVAIIVGIAAGWIAEQVTGRRHGLVTNLIVGLLGALLGWFLATNVLDMGLDGWIEWLLASAIGAIILLAVFGLVRRR
ncbi:GlsB/YeaQ/YmgE family stress response membrane protein [Brevundimonas sp.]|uniref:GlsB/YeaQ/YmgE family stress response membrane protein n=1 Tax=Brevundimonas sp. TaxID=1871086 RepID=UPI0025CE49D1|nr:GlsB/YeaQ/YmgE family stress response membrane protein [Brevundimonas sp.]